MLIILERGNQFDYVFPVTKYFIEQAVSKRPAAPRRNWLSLPNNFYSYKPPLTVDLYAIFGRVVQVGLQEGGCQLYWGNMAYSVIISYYHRHSYHSTCSPPYVVEVE